MTAPHENSCSKYCESFGHACVAAAEEVDEDCAVKYSVPCDQAIDGTSDMLCTCRRDSHCAPFSQWPGVDGDVICKDCTALVMTAPYENSCSTYCRSFGHVCVAAAEEVNEDCAVKYSVPCDQAIND